jgi:hypothetical protein
MPSPKIAKAALEVLEQVKNSEQVKGALSLIQNYITPQNQKAIVKKLVNVPPKDLTLDHLALRAMGDNMYLNWPGLEPKVLAPQSIRQRILSENWPEGLVPSNTHKAYQDDIPSWLNDGGPFMDGTGLYTDDAVTKHLDNLAVRLPHPLDLFRTSELAPENYIKKPWHSTTLRENAYSHWSDGPEAGFRVPGDTPLVFSQGLADKDEILAPLNDLIQYRFKKQGGLVRGA